MMVLPAPWGCFHQQDLTGPLHSFSEARGRAPSPVQAGHCLTLPGDALWVASCPPTRQVCWLSPPPEQTQQRSPCPSSTASSLPLSGAEPPLWACLVSFLLTSQLLLLLPEPSIFPHILLRKSTESSRHRSWKHHKLQDRDGEALTDHTDASLYFVDKGTPGAPGWLRR